MKSKFNCFVKHINWGFLWRSRCENVDATRNCNEVRLTTKLPKLDAALYTVIRP